MNFDPGLVRLLREVKYFDILGVMVPSTAFELNKSVEVFRVLIGNLEVLPILLLLEWQDHQQREVGTVSIVGSEFRASSWSL